MQKIRRWCLDRKIEIPGEKFIRRYFASFSSRYESNECGRIVELIPEISLSMLLNSISASNGVVSLLDMRKDPGRIGLETFNQVLAQLRFITSLNLPTLYISNLNPVWVAEVFRRLQRQDPWEIRRISENRQIGLYAVYLTSRLNGIVDSLIDVLIDAVHKINSQAEKKLRTELGKTISCLLYTSPSPRDATLSRMPSSA